MLSHITALLLVLLVGNADAQSSSLTTVEWRTGNSRVDNLIESLTPEEKISLVHGSVDTTGYQQQAGYVTAVPRLGIPPVRLTDGEAGVNVVDNATAVPMQLNVAATWSKSAAYQSGYVPGMEAKILGQAVLLAPRVNILRDPVQGYRAFVRSIEALNADQIPETSGKATARTRISTRN
jgi:beta-glucosidase